jgi:hypothetical protein
VARLNAPAFLRPAFPPLENNAGEFEAMSFFFT